jgi:hypothetical protein
MVKEVKGREIEYTNVYGWATSGQPAAGHLFPPALFRPLRRLSIAARARLAYYKATGGPPPEGESEGPS